MHTKEFDLGRFYVDSAGNTDGFLANDDTRDTLINLP